ncbi:MAG: TSUP family transporter [Bacteroidales bacterium]
MSFTTILILILIGLIAGSFSGLIGIGGAILIIPALMYFMQMNQISAQGTSLAIMLPPIGLMAVLNYHKAGAVNLKYAAIIAIAFFIGGYFGSKLAVNLNQEILRKIFAIVLIGLAIKILWSK